MSPKHTVIWHLTSCFYLKAHLASKLTHCQMQKCSLELQQEWAGLVGHYSSWVVVFLSRDFQEMGAACCLYNRAHADTILCNPQDAGLSLNSLEILVLQSVISDQGASNASLANLLGVLVSRSAVLYHWIWMCLIHFQCSTPGKNNIKQCANPQASYWARNCGLLLHRTLPFHTWVEASMGTKAYQPTHISKAL